jgi:hypothetical protein
MADLRHLVPSRKVIDRRGASKGQPTKEPQYDNAEDQAARVAYGDATMQALKIMKRAERDPERRDPMQATLKQLSAMIPPRKPKAIKEAKN